MLRPGKNPQGDLPNYYAAAATSTAIPSGGAYGGGYGHISSDDYQSKSSGRRSFSRQYDNAFKDKPRRSNQPDFLEIFKRYAKEPFAWVSLTAAFFFLMTVHFRGQRNWILRSVRVPNGNELVESFHNAQKDLENCRDESTRKQASTYDLQDQLTTMRKQVEKLKLDKAAAEQKPKEKLSEKHKEHIDTLTARDFAWKEQVEILQNATQRESKRSALELFGPGPHHVKITVIFPDDEKEKEEHFILEMAPLDVMPHSVHFFLQQVVHGLWNDAWFYLNGPHVLQAGPEAGEEEEYLWNLAHPEEDERAYAMHKFKEASLEHLSFPEYSDQFPHEKWTVGFTGRPGGPDFYINKLDNTKQHGPGGQDHHDLIEYADPCFAKVVDGFDVLKRMYKLYTYPDEDEWGWFYEEPVHIVNAKIMEDLPLKIEVAPDTGKHTRKSEKPLKKFKIENQVDP